MPGMKTSRRITANSPLSRWRSASSPEVATSTSARSSMTVRIASRLRSSSSTTSTRACVVAPGSGAAAGAAGVTTLGTGWTGRVTFMLLFGRRLGQWRKQTHSAAGLADPDPEQRQQEVDVDWLGDIIGCAGVEALLAVALHRLGSDRDQ